MAEDGAVLTPRFHWSARDGQGQRVAGDSLAASAAALRQRLLADGLVAEEIRPVRARTWPVWCSGLHRAWLGRTRRQRRQARVDLCASLATLIDAGMPLERALATLAGSPTRSEAERRLLSDCQQGIRDGIPLATICRDHPAWFDAFDAAILSAGQDAGDLTGALRSIADRHRRGSALGHRLAIALAYPALLALAAVGAWIFLAVAVLPSLTTLLTEARQPIPTLTRLVAVSGNALLYAWPLLIVGVLAGAWAWGRLRDRSPTIGRWSRRLPWTRFQARLRVAQVAQALARLRRAGIPLTKACAIAGATCDDPTLRRLLDRAVRDLESGASLAEALSATPGLDGEFLDLIAVGESSGELTDLLATLADRSFEAADRDADRLAAALGPLSIAGLAVVIAILVLSCIQPLARLGDLL